MVGKHKKPLNPVIETEKKRQEIRSAPCRRVVSAVTVRAFKKGQEGKPRGLRARAQQVEKGWYVKMHVHACL